MRAVRWIELGQLEQQEIAAPPVRPGMVLVRVKAAGVCSTDLHLFYHGYPGLSPGVVLGHELAGEVVEVGENVTGVSAGDRVAVEPSLPCGECDLCREGRLNLCRCFRHLGQQVDGAFAEFVAVPARNVHPLPDGLPYELGALVEPVGCCLHALNRVEVHMGDVVVIVGDGFFGLLFLQLLRLAGATRIAVLGHHDFRLSLARELGAELVINNHHTAPDEAVAKLAQPRGVDMCFEIAGTSSAVTECLRLVRPGGRILLFSAYKNKVETDFNLVVGKEINLIAANASPNVWTKAIDVISGNSLQLERLITHRFPLTELGEAFTTARNKDSGIKMLVYP